MSRVTITLDGLCTEDLRTLLRLWRFTDMYGAPRAIRDAPTVALDGSYFKITLPAVYPDRAREMLALFDRQRVQANGDRTHV